MYVGNNYSNYSNYNNISHISNMVKRKLGIDVRKRCGNCQTVARTVATVGCVGGNTDRKGLIAMEPQTFTTNLSLDEIEQRLAGLENFDLKEKTEGELKATVGSAFKYRFLGVYVTQDYQAPLAIDARDNGDGTSTVELAERGNEGTLFTTGKADRFFEDGLAELRTALGG